MGLGTSRRAACRWARAAARGQMGCINLGAGSSGPRCSVLSWQAGFGFQMWAWGGEGGWDTAPDVCSLSKGRLWDSAAAPQGPRGLGLQGLGQGASLLAAAPAHPPLQPLGLGGFRVHRTLTQQLPSPEAPASLCEQGQSPGSCKPGTGGTPGGNKGSRVPPTTGSWGRGVGGAVSRAGGQPLPKRCQPHTGLTWASLGELEEEARP